MIKLILTMMFIIPLSYASEKSPCEGMNGRTRGQCEFLKKKANWEDKELLQHCSEVRNQKLRLICLTLINGMNTSKIKKNQASCLNMSTSVFGAPTEQEMFNEIDRETLLCVTSIYTSLKGNQDTKCEKDLRQITLKCKPSLGISNETEDLYDDIKSVKDKIKGNNSEAIEY